MIQKTLARAARAVRAQIWQPSVGGAVGDAALRSGSYASHAGETVSAKSIMNVSAAFDCTRKNAQVVASLPLDQIEKGASGSHEKIEDDLSDLLTQKPNSEQTAFEFIEGLVAQLMLQGNAYAEKLTIGPKGRLASLRPLHGVTPRRNSNGALEYVFWDRGQREVLPAEKVFHVRGFGAGDGVGMSVIAYGAASMGAALAADRAAGKAFSNGMTPSGVLTVDQELTDAQRDQLEANMSDYAGSSRAGKMMILEAGLTWQQVQVSPEDMQLLETRRFTVEDVCRWFGVPPVVVGHAGQGQTMWGSGVEAIMLSWLTLGINPLLKRIETRISADLMRPEVRRRRRFEFKREAMIQMDSKAKGDFLLKMRMAGIMSGDEGRDKINLPRRGGAADELAMQTSMQLLDQIEKGEA